MYPITNAIICNFSLLCSYLVEVVSYPCKFDIYDKNIRSLWT